MSTLSLSLQMLAYRLSSLRIALARTYSTKFKNDIENSHPNHNQQDQITTESILTRIRNYSQLKQGKDFRIRPPIVTIMGHVDHGKTTLLDSIRKSELVKQEHGGITQHIGAFVVSLQDDKNIRKSRIEDLVVFLDTPGHKAFSSMRERGALVTDIVVLVVAADDGVMEQTIESISFAQKSQVPIIVAINKIDKIKNDPDLIQNVKFGLKSHGIVLEEDGGDIQSIKISALQGDGIYELKEAIIALAETLELRAPIDGNVEGSIIESSIHPHRGRLTTILVQQGTLKRSDILISTNSRHSNVSWAKVRAMFDEYGQVINEVPPGFPAQVIGWRDDTLPEAGDHIWQLNSEKQVRDILGMGKELERQIRQTIDAKAIEQKRDEHDTVYKAELAARREAGIRYKRKRSSIPRTKLIQTEGDELKTSIVLKADVNGSLEVLLDLFDSFPNETSPAKLDLIHYGLGNVTENDIELASCFPNGMIYTFNVGVFTPALLKKAKELNISIKRFNVIYHLVDHLKETLQERMPFIDREEILGEAIIIQEFVVNEKKKKIPVAGSRCSKGILKKNGLYKLIRNGKIIAKDLKLSSMRHHKDEVDSIKKDFECGLMIANNIISNKTNEQVIRFQPQDLLVCYQLVNVRLPLQWKPKGF
ncbi:mitochondrial translation initiation factor 2 [Dermatophagoides pteronyssinus]|uniref:Translation initiation factor IF-2, mitochondrial-like n=1 Tax=Dermatophagoides pteronyssinus TaxID=6956 RepID=A0A6P6XSY6_DERPT|nr:translation initiation factor IF-2, mitochondrial-like [Dermatophagoides pteronyssinus]